MSHPRQGICMLCVAICFTASWYVTWGLRNGLNGVHFNVSAHDFPPFQHLARHSNGSLIYHGSTPNVIYWMTEKFNMSFSLVPVDDMETVVYGSVQAGLNQITTRKVEISTLCFVPTIERSKIMDFSYPIAIESYRLMVPKPKEESRLFGPLRPFRYQVWVCFFLSAVSVLVLLILITGVYSNWSGKEKRTFPFYKYLDQYALYMISVFTNHGNEMRSNLHSFRVVLSLWLLTACVLVYSYSGTLMSALTVPKLKSVVNSLEDLADNKELILTLKANSVISHIILNGTTKTFKTIGDTIRRNPDSIYLTQKQGLENIFSLKYAYPVAESYTSYVVNVDLQRSGHCRFHLTDRIPLTQAYTFGLEKGSKFNYYISEKLQYLWEIGLMKYWLKENLPRVDKCVVKERDSAKQMPIKLVDLTSAFFVLGTGIGMSCICFILEILLWITKVPHAQPIAITHYTVYG